VYEGEGRRGKVIKGMLRRERVTYKAICFYMPFQGDQEVVRKEEGLCAYSTRAIIIIKITIVVSTYLQTCQLINLSCLIIGKF
jgi:hypothetical protein